MLWVTGNIDTLYIISVTPTGIVRVRINIKIILLIRSYCSVCFVNVECLCLPAVWYGCRTQCVPCSVFDIMSSLRERNEVTDKGLT